MVLDLKFKLNVEELPRMPLVINQAYFFTYDAQTLRFSDHRIYIYIYIFDLVTPK